MGQADGIADMHWLTWLLFESPTALGMVLGLGLFAMLVYWRRCGRRNPLLIGLGLSVVLMIAQGLVVTRREHAGQVLWTIEKDLLASRCGALEAALADDFDAGNGLDRSEFLTFVRHQLEVVRIRWLDRLLLRVVESAGGEYGVIVSYRADVTGSRADGSMISEWALRFAWRQDRWQITHIRPVNFAGESAITWRDLDRSRRPHGG